MDWWTKFEELLVLFAVFLPGFGLAWTAAVFRRRVSLREIFVLVGYWAVVFLYVSWVF